MSEEAPAESGATTPAAPDTAGLAQELALEEARSDPALREDVAAFLRDQRALIDIQKHHLQQQFKPQMRQLKLAIWEKRLGVLLRLATGFVGVAVAVALGFMVWQAAQSSGLRIQPLSVPPELAARGITGEVMAGRLLDHLNRMQRATNSRRASRTYASDWSQQPIRLDIPQTGISLDELDRYLRDRLGNDIHVSGDITSAPAGVTLTVRTGTGDFTISGPEAELPALTHQAALAVYRLTQPYLYSVYIRASNPDEAMAVAKNLALTGPVQDRPWAYNSWGLQARLRESVDAGLALFANGMARQPENPLLHTNLGQSYLAKGQWEPAFDQFQQAVPLANNKEGLFRPDTVTPMRLGYAGWVDRMLGDFRQANIRAVQVLESGDPGQISPLADMAMSQLGLHEIRAARATMGQSRPQLNTFLRELNDSAEVLARIQIDSAAENWPAALAGQTAAEALAQKNPGLRSQFATTMLPHLVLARAHLGRIAEAERDLAPTPDDCDPCLIARAQLAALQSQHARADWWFARAVAHAPSIPFASHEWGRALLVRGQTDAAIAQFRLSNLKGPNFADPLQGWGEALMAKNQSHLALAKFAAAEKLAPNWGRLHLKWGQALVHAGKPDEAKAKFARAATLDLTPSEKAELARLRR